MVDILEGIKEMSEEELTSLVYAIKDRRDTLRYDKLKNFKVGDKVKWTHGRGINKEAYEGEVDKVNLKTIAIKEKNRPWMRWRISPSMLTIIKGDES
tara:strand:+ start:223 stop:513 length:291 start_codon:yes stop_codon:yes gene_type:complete